MTDSPKADEEAKQSELGAAKQPEPVAAKAPEPVAAKAPEPVAAKAPEPVAAKAPEPVAAKAPEPVAAKAPEPVAAKAPEPVAAKAPEPVAAKAPEPVAAKAPDPVAAKAPDPVAVKAPKLVAEKAPESAAAQRPEPINGAVRLGPSKLDIVRIIHEAPPIPKTMDLKTLKAHTRRDFLIYGAGALAAAAGLWWLLPQDTQTAHLTMAQQQWLDSLEQRVSPKLAAKSAAVKSKFLDRVLTFDDDVAAALFSPTRSVPTYSADLITPNLRNNYDGQTPDPAYIDTWRLELTGLASGKSEKLPITALTRFPMHQQITRLVCVEGWSAIAGWGGLRFSDLLAAYPPKPGAKWAKLISDVNLDGDGNSDPYYVSIDLTTAIHPQTLLATRHDGKVLEVEHGAPVRLVVPMKLGLKNIKAVTRIEYTADQPADYWNDRGYSKYDGI